MPFKYETKLICDKCGFTGVLSSYFPIGTVYSVKLARENGWSVTKKKHEPYVLHCSECRNRKH